MKARVGKKEFVDGCATIHAGITSPSDLRQIQKMARKYATIHAMNALELRRSTMKYVLNGSVKLPVVAEHMKREREVVEHKMPLNELAQMLETDLEKVQTFIRLRLLFYSCLVIYLD